MHDSTKPALGEAVGDPPAEKPTCAYPWQQMMIDLTGEVVPCCFWANYGNTGKPLGNTNVNTIDEIWNGPEYQALRRAIVEDNVKGFPCHDCLPTQYLNGGYPKFTWPSMFGHDSGLAYSGPILHSFLDRAEALDEPWILLEDGRQLGPLAAVDDVRQLGGGRFAIENRSLFMSASDDSSPNENGRRYELCRGAERWAIKTVDTQAVSGRNLQAAYHEYRSNAVTMTARPTMLTYISSSDCNIDCGMCNQHRVRKFKVQHRPETEVAVIELTRYLNQFTWAGGEPFLLEGFRRFYTDFRPEDNPNLTLGFTSNGTMISEKVLGQLLKFPRVHAAISMDSFIKDSFERIRGGARFDVVLANVLRAMEHHDTPDWMFSIGAVIQKSNIRELPFHVSFQQQHELHVNLSPMLIYPVHERLDIFQDCEREIAGWDEALDEARTIAREGAPRLRRGNNLTSMVEMLQNLLAAAKRRYARTVPLVAHIDDPSGALARMRRPGLVYFRENGTRPLGYALLDRPGAHVVHAPASELNVAERPYVCLYHDLHDDTDILASARLTPAGHRQFSEMRLTIPPFEERVFVRNLRMSNAGRPKPDGLIVIDPRTQL